MKHIFLFPSILLCVFLFSACNQEEGLGGTSSLEGYVYNIVHNDENLSFRTDTFPASGKNIYLIFGNDINKYFGDKTDVNNNGLFRFDYLRKGDYVVYTFSEPANGNKEPVFAEISIGKSANVLPDTLFIHTGKAYGTAMIRGEVTTSYHHNGSYRGEGPGTGMRAYIKHVGENGHFNDVRVIDGVFYFQKLLPGKYEVAVETEDPDTEVVSLVIQTITITEAGKVYELPELFRVNTSV